MERIGKIGRANIGQRGDRFGFFVHLSGPDWGANSFIHGAADPNPPEGVDPEEYFDDRMADFAAAMHCAARMCRDAKVERVDQLKGLPIAATFGPDGVLLTWRMLTEAIP